MYGTVVDKSIKYETDTGTVRAVVGELAEPRREDAELGKG